MTRITRAVIAAALVSAALLPAGPAGATSCRLLMDPRAVNTPFGQIQVPWFYLYC